MSTQSEHWGPEAVTFQQPDNQTRNPLSEGLIWFIYILHIFYFLLKGQIIHYRTQDLHVLSTVPNVMIEFRRV